MTVKILGISAYYHDSAAALLIDGEIIAAAHEERFTRIKHDASFPEKAARYVLEESGLKISELTAVAFYDKPYIKFERLLETYHAFAPKGLRSFIHAVPVWIKEKLFMKNNLWKELEKIEGGKFVKKPALLFPEHHLSHAASAFYPSPFEEAAILTVDGVGEWATSTICKGSGKDISILKELCFPHSIGLLYSAFTYYCGFKVNSGEYKLMGLAPYGIAGSARVKEYEKKICGNLADIRDDGSILLNMEYFDFATGLRMSNDDKWEKLFGIPARPQESEISQEYMDLALAIQNVTEDIIMKLAETTKKLTGSKNLCLAGGVALNCVANGKLQTSGMFDKIWIQPAAGDAGGALGAAYTAHHIWAEQERKVNPNEMDKMKGAYLGPEFGDKEIRHLITRHGAKCSHYEDFELLIKDTAKLIDSGLVVGWFQGRMEWGPRALGNRSILGDARKPDMQKKLNLKIKYREGFRPFAPSVIMESAAEFFEMDVPSPYMLLVFPVRETRRIPYPSDYDKMPLYERLYHLRSDVPAITHIDYSARIQSVHKETNERYWKLINAFKELTGYGVIVNTSFNVRGEPIVCTPEDAYKCFMRTEMDYLVIGDYLFKKTEQPNWQDKENWKETYKLD